MQPVLRDDGKDIVIELNFGEGRYYPGGPKCKYHDKIVDCLTFVSEYGGITGEILVKVLQHFDGIDLFPRVDNGPIPVLIPLFVEYINNRNHKWKVCLGVSYATTLWQIGNVSDSLD